MKSIEKFMEEELKMNPALDTASPTARTMWRIVKDAIERWENYRLAPTQFSHDHSTFEEFVCALAQATTYKSHPLGFEDSISDYWKHEAEEWVKELDSCPTCKGEKAVEVKPAGTGHSDDLSEHAPCPDCNCLAPALPVSATRPICYHGIVHSSVLAHSIREDIARKLSGYDDATWSKLREDRKRTYQRAADSLITQWPEFVKLFEVKL